MCAAAGTVARDWPALLLASACLGIAQSLWLRPSPMLLGAALALGFAGALLARETARVALGAVALACAGLWWGALRSDALDRTFLAERIGEAEPTRAIVTGPARRTPFALRVP